MKVGLYLTGQQHLDKDMVEAFDEQLSMVGHGWDSVFSGQHFLNEGNNKASLVNVPWNVAIADIAELSS